MNPMTLMVETWAKGHGKTPEELAKAVTGSWPANRLFPREPILEKYLRRMWFSSSIAWLIPLAIEEGATDIGLWGIDLESGEEYISQFVGCVHFLDLAQHKGVNIHLPKDSGLLRDPAPYPDRYETHLALIVEKKIHWLKHNCGEAQKEQGTTLAEVHRKEAELILTRNREGATPEETFTTSLKTKLSICKKK